MKKNAHPVQKGKGRSGSAKTPLSPKNILRREVMKKKERGQ